MKIGKITIENPFILAPMEAVNCWAFRKICRKYGAGLVYTEMIDTDQYHELGKEAFLNKWLDFSKKESPITVQLGGHDPDTILKVGQLLADHADIIDFNIGCPLPDQLGKKAGVYLMKHPNLIERTLKPLIETVSNPVTAKMRAGWDDDSINSLEVAKILQGIGIKAIALHPRTRKERYMGHSRWELIRELSDNLDIPVIGSGDILKPGDAKAMLEHTKCDAVMIARAAMGNPYFFTQLKDYFGTGKYKEPDRKRLFFEFYDLYKKGPRFRVGELRDHAIWFSTGYKKASRIKQLLHDSKSEKEIVTIIEREMD